MEIDVKLAFANGSILGWSASVFLAAAPGVEEIGEKVSGKETFLPRARLQCRAMRKYENRERERRAAVCSSPRMSWMVYWE
jgi:hypothetical protein